MARRTTLSYKLPIVLALLGETDLASEAISGHEARLGDQVNPAAERFRAFAAAFRLVLPTLTQGLAGG